MKRFTLVLLGVILTIGVNAQVNNIRWGVKVGGNLSQMTTKIDGDKLDGAKNRFGFHAGGMMEYSFSPSFAIQPELLFSMNSTGQEYDITEDVTQKTHIDIWQIQVPINLKYKLGDDALGYFVTAGPYFGIGLSGKLKGDGMGSRNIYDEDEMGTDLNLKRFDIGIGVGLGVEIKKIMVGASYQFGLMNLSNANKVKSRVGTFQLSVGYFF